MADAKGKLQDMLSKTLEHLGTFSLSHNCAGILRLMGERARVASRPKLPRASDLASLYSEQTASFTLFDRTNVTLNLR